MKIVLKSFSFFLVAGLATASFLGCGSDTPTVTQPDTSNFSVQPLDPPPGFSGAGGANAPAAQALQAAPTD